jgi:hypothetical protein
VSDVIAHTPSAAAGPPASPAARRLALPRWLDLRLVAGCTLVLVAVVLGARVIGAADRTTPVWAVSHDLAAGTRLGPGDLVSRDVRLGAAGSAYVAAGALPAGYVLTRAVHSGELLPRAALSPSGAAAAAARVVTVPVEQQHLPQGLRHGERVDIYVTPKPAPGQPPPRPERVLSGVPVDEVSGDRGRLVGPTSTVAVAVRVPASEVADLIGALRTGSIDLVRVPVVPGSTG